MSECNFDNPGPGRNQLQQESMRAKGGGPQIAVVLWELERPLDEKTTEFYAWLDVYAGLVFLQAEVGRRDREHMDANEVMAVDRENAKGSPKLDVASLLIKSELESAPKLARDMYRKAEAESIDERTFKSAYYKLGVKATNRNGKWWWTLPGGPQLEPEKEADPEAVKTWHAKIDDPGVM